MADVPYIALLVRAPPRSAFKESRPAELTPITARPDRLGCSIKTAVHLGGMDEVIAQMRDVFEEERGQFESDVIEENEVLMDLAHVADMGHRRHAEFSRQHAHRDELADTRHAHGAISEGVMQYPKGSCQESGHAMISKILP